MFGMGTGVASSLWPPERVPGRFPARETPPAGGVEPNFEGRATAVSAAPSDSPRRGDLALGKLHDQAERAISNG